MHTKKAEQLQIKLNYQMDDAHFRQKISDTGVLLTKNFTKWRWEAVEDIIRGPFLNPKRLEEAMKSSKFLKRIIGFYLPFKNRFADIRNTKPNQKYVRIGCLLLTVLMVNPEGVKYLTDIKLMKQLSTALRELDPMENNTSSGLFFSKQRMEETLTCGYFAMLGVLSCEVEGLALLERYRIFSSLYKIADLRSRDDIMTELIKSMDYSRNGHARVILSKAMATGHRDVRLAATEHLGRLIVRASATNNIEKWAIGLLLTQLYDPSIDISQKAVEVCTTVCDSKLNLEYLVTLRPSLDHLVDIGKPLLFRFMASSVGLGYLQSLDYISSEIDDWFHGKNEDYVLQVESLLAQLAWSSKHSKDHFVNTNRFNGTILSHFYGELVRTEEGCVLLSERGHFDEFTRVIIQYGNDDIPYEANTLQLKSFLWAVGHIGASETGFEFFQDNSLLEAIVNIADTARIVSVRA